MKKLLLLLLSFIPFSGVNALSYDGVPQYAYPSFTKDGQLYSSALVAQTPCSYFSQAWGCSNFQPNNPGFFSMSRSPYYYYTDGTLGFGENYKSAQQSIIEIDLTNTPSGSGARLLDGGCQDSGYCYDLYMSGADLKYRLWYLNTTEPNFIYQHTWTIPQLAGEWKDVNFGGYQSKHIVIGFRQYFYTYNNLVGSKSYLQKISMQRITDSSRSAYVDFTQSGSIDGILMTNTFTPQDFDGVPFFFNYSNSNNFWNKVDNYVSNYLTTKASFPYYRDTIEVSYSPGAYYPYHGNMLTFPNAYYYAFGDLTTRIRSSSGSSDSWNFNDDNFLTSFYDIDNALANFYVSTGSNIYGSEWNGSNGGTSGGTSGSGSTGGSTLTAGWYDSCGSVLDVGCYIASTVVGIFNFGSDITSFVSEMTTLIIDTIKKVLSSVWTVAQIPTTPGLGECTPALFTGLTDTMSGGLFTKIGYTISAGINQIASAWNAPEDGKYYCLFGQGVLVDYGRYRTEDMTWFDYVLIIVVLTGMTSLFSALIIRNKE